MINEKLLQILFFPIYPYPLYKIELKFINEKHHENMIDTTIDVFTS